jgi:hypothetical protein
MFKLKRIHSYIKLDLNAMSWSLTMYAFLLGYMQLEAVQHVDIATIL